MALVETRRVSPLGVLLSRDGMVDVSGSARG